MSRRHRYRGGRHPMNPLNAYLAQSVLQERYARAEAHNRARRERSDAVRPVYDAVTIRRVTPDDGVPPHGAALLAEVDERVVAVRSLLDGGTLADPFQPTAELVALLDARA